MWPTTTTTTGHKWREKICRSRRKELGHHLGIVIVPFGFHDRNAVFASQHAFHSAAVKSHVTHVTKFINDLFEIFSRTY
jgi:hypothetical protein